MTINELTLFIGWCTVINMSIVAISGIMLTLFKESIINIHHKLMGIDKHDLPKLYFAYLGNYKIGIMLLNFAPYLALKLMA